MMLSPKAKGEVTDTQKKLGALHVHIVRGDRRQASRSAMRWT